MELTTIEMPKEEARKAFLEYRRAVRERHDAEDQMIMRGYRALSQGHQVINLLDVMKAGGEDDQGRPKLAIARADFQSIGLIRRANGGAKMHIWNDRRTDNKRRMVEFPSGTFSTRKYTERNWKDETVPISAIYARAIVPIVPPALRPQHALSNYHVLWEAEWSRVVPRDPALLKHAGEWLYVVLAVWELTPLEQAVLGLTRN